MRSQVAFTKGGLICPAIGRQLFVDDWGKELDDPFLEDVKGLAAEDNELHAIGGVVLGVKLDKLVSHIDPSRLGLRLEHLEIAGREMTVRVARVRQRLLQLVKAPGVILQVLLVLGVNGPQFSVQRARQKEGLDEELGKAVQSLTQGRGVSFRGVLVVGRFRGHVKKVVCRGAGRVGVGATRVGREILAILVLDGEFLGPHKQQLHDGNQPSTRHGGGMSEGRLHALQREPCQAYPLRR